MLEHQITLVSLDELVSEKHQYRKFKLLFNFKAIEPDLIAVEAANNNKGFSILRLFKCLLLQFMEDMSYRAMQQNGFAILPW